MEFEDQELPTQTIESINYEEDLPSLEELDIQKKNQSYPDSNKTTQGDRSKTPLMEKIKGLLDLTSSYLQDLEKDHPGVGADFMAILAEGASRAMGNQPRGQSKEDRCVIIRLDQNHEAPKCNPFQLRQTIKKLVPDKGLISDAAAIMQYKNEIETRFGKATVERQETWTTLRLRWPMDGSLLEELGSIRDHVPIQHIGWTHRSLDDEVNGFVRICAPENRASKFPSRLRVFGEAVSVQRIRTKQSPITCDKFYGFHSTRTCARSLKCKLCGVDAHEGPCQKAPRCLNYRGPHASTEKCCPARPRRSNGVFIRPTGLQLKNIRAAGGRKYAKAQNTADELNMNLTSTASTENESPSS
ncbi:hypothetical protein EPUL_004131 [Erysiphe pulchra]|uniref:Uncharacterized protein n=1 Tax=Erysiphe pulchra TaxID=225359 RepID=A0A2S4PUH3_9PEZI|nr:hypothetical protein EPUL_004131 [Erysiphe pulchra]